jgi:hypothetical protein
MRRGSVWLLSVGLLLAAAAAISAAPPSNAYWTAYFDPDTNLYSVASINDPVNGGAHP